MALKLLSSGFSSVLVLPVRLGVGCFRRASSGFHSPGSSAISFATVNRKFQPKPKPSGFGGFPAAGHFPFATGGRGCRQFAGITAFPANLSNTAVKALPSVAGTAGKPAAPYLQR